MDKPCSGLRNKFLFFQAPGTPFCIQGLLEILSEALQSKAPSRFLCILPKPEHLPSHFLELATFSPASPIFQNANLNCTMSIILAMNKESMLTDPIKWDVFKDRLRIWSEDWPSGLLSVSLHSDLLFSERSPLLHPPRALSKHPINVLFLVMPLICG